MPHEESGPVATRTAPNNNDLVDSISGGTPGWQRTGGVAAGRRKQHRPLPGVASALAGQPWFLNASPQRRRQMLQIVQEAAQRSAARKARVAAYPDLAQRVCRVLGLKRFAQWGGYVPAQQSEGPSGRGTAFDTPVVRRDLVAILREVAERDEAALKVASTVTLKVNSAVDSAAPVGKRR